MNPYPGRREHSRWTLKTRQLWLGITDVQFVLGHALLTTTQLYALPGRKR